MVGQELKRGADVLQKYDYGYGQIDGSGNLDTTKNNGQLAKIESHIGANKQWTQKFRYDSIGRLSESEERRGDTNALTYKQNFDFDRFGNMYRKAANNNPTGQENPLPYTPIEDADISKTTNRFTTETTYDDAGNVVTDNKFREMGFAYDANGRMIKATKPSVPDARTVYDALGNRVATKINDIWQYVIYDAFGQLVAEYGTDSQTDGIKYVQQDWQGSVRTITTNAGFVSSRTDHQAFGEEIGAGTGLRTVQQGYGTISTPRQGYGLTEKDEATGLNHTWFRKNENRAGRWTSPDPYNGSASVGDPQSFNRYSYVGNQPANFIDPSGLLRIIVFTGCSWDGGWYCTGYYEINIDTFGGYHPRAITAGGGRGRGPLPENDCQKFADIVEEIARSAANAAEFMQKLIDRTIGANIPLNAASRNDFERAAGITGATLGDSGFKEKFRDGTNLQARHFVAGLWAGYLLGPGLAQIVANSHEDFELQRTGLGPFAVALVPTDASKADVALNSVSVALGTQLVPKAEERRDVGDRGWKKIPGNPGYKGLSAAIRNQVCD